VNGKEEKKTKGLLQRAMIPSGSQTTNGIHFASLESGGIDMRKYLLEKDFLDRVKE